MSDIAKVAGVSRTTVSFVLNNVPNASISEATRQRVLHIAEKLSYVPHVQAANLARGRTMMIALVLRLSPEQMSVDGFMNEILRGAIQVLEPEGYHLLVHAAQPDAAASTYGQLVRTRKVDGLMISLPLINDPEVNLLHREGTPIVLIGSSEHSDIPCVDADNLRGGYLATRHLIDLGHRRIGFISNAPFAYRSGSERRDGYRQALAEAGLPYDADLVREGHFTDTSGSAPMHALLDLDVPPTAVFVASDIVALGALDAVFKRSLKIPADISIIGFDDIFLSKHLRPPLTTIQSPAYQLGKIGGELLLKKIDDEPLTPLRTLLPVQLIQRHSTAPLSQA